MTVLSTLDLVVAGLGTEALFLAEAARLRPAVNVVAVCEQDPVRRWLLAPSGACDDVRGLNEFAVGDAILLLDATLPEADALFRRWSAAGGRILVTGTSALTSAQLADWHAVRTARSESSAALDVGVIPSWSPFPDAALADDLVQRDALGPLRTARWTSHGLLPLTRPKPIRVGESRSWLCDRLWPITESLRAWGYSLCSHRATHLHAGDQRAALVISRWQCAGSPTGLLVTIDLDETTRVARAPGWTLEGEQASYGDGVLYRTTLAGEIVDIPQTLPLVSGRERFDAAIEAFQNKQPQPLSLAAAARSLATAESLATPR